MTNIALHRPKNEGFVLVAVLSVLALLSGTVIAMMLLSRTSIDSAELVDAKLQMDAMTQSAISMAGYQLFTLKTPMQSINNQQIRLDQGMVTFNVTTDAAKVDLNGSSAKLLAAAYQAARLTTLTPQSFAARIIDWRDADDAVTEGGAESSDYAAAHLDYGTRNAPFRSVDDLRWVLGISSSDIIALANFVTVYNPRGRLDAFSAPPMLISSLPGVTAEMVTDALTVRAARSAANIASLDDTFLVQASLIDTTLPNTYRVRMSLQPIRGRSRAVEVVMCAGVFENDPYEVLYWSGN